MFGRPLTAIKGVDERQRQDEPWDKEHHVIATCTSVDDERDGPSHQTCFRHPLSSSDCLVVARLQSVTREIQNGHPLLFLNHILCHRFVPIFGQRLLRVFLLVRDLRSRCVYPPRPPSLAHAHLQLCLQRLSDAAPTATHAERSTT